MRHLNNINKRNEYSKEGYTKKNERERERERESESIDVKKLVKQTIMSSITLMIQHMKILLQLLQAYPNDENEHIANDYLFYAIHEFLLSVDFVVDHY